MTTVNISLPDEVTAFIETQLSEEGFTSTSDYLLSLVRRAQKRKARRDLEALILEGLQGPTREVTEEFWDELRAECDAVNPDHRSPE